MCWCVFIPVHGSGVDYSVGYFVMGFDGLDSRAVSRSDVPNGVVKDYGGIGAAGVKVVWFDLILAGAAV